MSTTPQIVSTPAQSLAVIRMTVPIADIKSVMGPAVGELFAGVAAQSVAVIGSWFTHHFRRPTDTFDFEAGVPVATPVAAAGRVLPSTRPALTVARTEYKGGYEGLAGAWGEFHAWLKANNHTPTGDLWEWYIVGPESTSDPAGWRTILEQPLVTG